MASIFNTLHVGYTGLNASQVAINTTSHNIANAETEGYTRQRTILETAYPLDTGAGYIGSGVEIADVKRVFDNFVFDRYTSISADKEYSDYQEKTLEQLSTYFPEIDGVGIKADLAEYYNMWQTLADNPDNDAIKVALAKQTETLTEHITETQSHVLALQSQVNEEISVDINEVNSLAKELSELNKSIDVAEAGGGFSANDLRDKRNVIERSLARLIGSEVTVGQVTSNIRVDSSSNTVSESYTLSVNGLNIVDGSTYHPIHTSNEKNPFGFYEISYERQDGVMIPLEESLRGGKIGAAINLRGGNVNTTDGMPVDGTLQKTISQLDAFAKGLIESTNNLYASNSTIKMESNSLKLNGSDSMVSSPLNVKEGSFDIVVYDIDGNIAARRNIKIDESTSLTGKSNSNSVEAQMEAQTDDNNDGNANNDIDDFVKFNWATYASGDNALEFSMDPLAQSQGYKFAIEDSLSDSSFESGTNFAGALGMNRYFDGDSARNIGLNSSLESNTTTISAGKSPVSGDNTLALDMMQHQFEEFEFNVGDDKYHTTSYGMFDILATEVGTATNAAILRSETVSTQFTAVEMEYFSTSKVSIDEEMTNLIKFQTSYGAAAKIITTIDQMMQTLLGLKS
ncbi:MAG: flagellar hook-associated protein FlgK [Campylobacterota bacterium]|nr:flagellar hook-associated protein FlgK [Campylobacterota bacterium]